tara:strand:- start:272 stop:562 length:291 start_codon:yes stop_codon:yes gene_type:complete
MSERFHHAINDFILGKGKDIPSQDVCEILIQKHPIVNKFISEAINNKIEKISIMPYGETLQCWSNPVVYGNCSRTIPILDPNDDNITLIEVNFDRN